ncbi:metal-sulfur cluster assembly factor [Pseudarthrobacter oxydans]|uniref:metal-sulfur cluster assembly factor n=1 Tax=Pseudarthrobacter oxydans TaxID=1671 RepID=UPI00382B85CB
MTETEISASRAINLEPPPLNDVQVALKNVVDPDLGANIVDLGLVYGVEYGENNALVITMTLTSAACPLTEMIEEQVGKALSGVVGRWQINWVWMPPWGPDRITDDGHNQMRGLGPPWR